MPQSFNKNDRISRGLSLLASPEEYDMLIAEFVRDTDARDVVERTYASDAATLTLKIRQNRERKAKILAQAFYHEVNETIWKILINAKIEEMERDDVDATLTRLEEDDPKTVQDIRQRAHDAAVRWCESDEGRREVGNLLKELGADEVEIELEVYKECRDELEYNGRTTAVLENRRMGALRTLWECREYRAISTRKGRGISNRRVKIEDGASIPQIAKPA